MAPGLAPYGHCYNDWEELFHCDRQWLGTSRPLKLKPMGLPTCPTTPRAGGVRYHLKTDVAVVREDGHTVPLHNECAPPLEICAECSIQADKVVGGWGGALLSAAEQVEHPAEKRPPWAHHLARVIKEAQKGLKVMAGACPFVSPCCE